jgi:hypothetical protein
LKQLTGKATAHGVRFGLVEMTSKDPKTGGLMMTSTKRKRAPLGLPRKNYWHLYSLQALDSEKLARIVNKILRREFQLVK